ncbi:hypothetical protein HDE_03871 [Halotydeus destructor]|nr:hypothetical protein HDE_03871 [Halotydeus destructor]
MRFFLVAAILFSTLSMLTANGSAFKFSMHMDVDGNQLIESARSLMEKMIKETIAISESMAKQVEALVRSLYNNLDPDMFKNIKLDTYGDQVRFEKEHNFGEPEGVYIKFSLPFPVALKDWNVDKFQRNFPSEKKPCVVLKNLVELITGEDWGCLFLEQFNATFNLPKENFYIEKTAKYSLAIYSINEV